MKLKCEKERKNCVSVKERKCLLQKLGVCWRINKTKCQRERERERERVGYEWPCHNNKVRVTSKRLCAYCETSSGLEKFQERESGKPKERLGVCVRERERQ